MRLHILFLLTSTAAFNVPKRRGGALSSIANMPSKNNKLHAGPKQKKQRHKPTEPAGGWPDDDKVLAELNEKSWSVFGVNLRDVRLFGNSSPGTWNNVKRDKCTAPMVKMCAAYVMVMCYGQEMVDTSIHCAW